MPDITTDVPDGLHSTPMDLFPSIWDGSWKNLPHETDEDGVETGERVAFAQRCHEFFQSAATLREKFDAVVWAGHVDGSIPDSIKSVRAPRTGETGGPKKVEKTAAELLLKK